MKEGEKKGVNAKAQGFFEWWNERAKIEAGDSVKAILSKIAIRLIGILLLIIFSPILAVIFVMVVAISL
ncbi:MAG: hypothetical protein ACI9DK_002968 [Vicingaceae bacterium]|jgi:hypothetical protein